MSRWLITGVSSGIGRALAEYLLERGDTVVGTLRSEAQMEEFAALAPGRAFAVKLDVTQDVGPAVDKAIADAGGLDVLVNNAGYALMGPVEDISLDEAQRQMDTNFMGVLKMCKAVLPHFRDQGAGRIINIASVAAVMGFPMSALYVASKHAVAGFSEAFGKEVERFGIKVTSVEPGGFRTNFGTGSLNLPAHVSSANSAVIEALKARMTGFAGSAANDPRKGAEVIAALAEMDQPPLHLALGADGYKMITDALKARLEEYDRHREFVSGTAYAD